MEAVPTARRRIADGAERLGSYGEATEGNDLTDLESFAGEEFGSSGVRCARRHEADVLARFAWRASDYARDFDWLEAAMLSFQMTRPVKEELGGTINGGGGVLRHRLLSRCGTSAVILDLGGVFR